MADRYHHQDIFTLAYLLLLLRLIRIVIKTIFAYIKAIPTKSAMIAKFIITMKATCPSSMAIAQQHSSREVRNGEKHGFRWIFWNIFPLLQIWYIIYKVYLIYCIIILYYICSFWKNKWAEQTNKIQNRIEKWLW